MEQVRRVFSSGRPCHVEHVEAAARPLCGGGYLVRTRELSAAEVLKQQLPSPEIGRNRKPPDQQDYPQREAVIYALRKLTSQDGGRSAAQWRALVNISAK